LLTYNNRHLQGRKKNLAGGPQDFEKRKTSLTALKVGDKRCYTSVAAAGGAGV